MDFKRIGKGGDAKFVLEMDFYEANSLLCMVLPAAEKSNIESFKKDAQACNRYTRDDKRRIRKIRQLMEDIQSSFDTMYEENK